MGILDDIVWPGGGPILFGRSGRRVLRKGQPGTATIVGIRVDRSAGEDRTQPDYTYALQVRPESGGAAFRCGLRQRLSPGRERAPVGTRVPVKIRGKKVVVDWERVLGTTHDSEVFVPGWSMRKAPADGVEDRSLGSARKRLASARAAEVTVLRTAQPTSIIGPLINVDLDVELRYADDGSTEQRRLTRVEIPDYMRAGVDVGAVLSAGVDKGGRRVTIDWEAAANGPHRVDPSPATPPPLEQIVQQPPPLDRVAGALHAISVQAVGAGDPTGADIDFDLYVAVSTGLVKDRVAPKDYDAYAAAHGVPAGAWSAIDAAMKGRIMTDPEFGTRYGAAWQAAMKRTPR